MRVLGRRPASRTRVWLFMALVIGALQLPLIAPLMGAEAYQNTGGQPARTSLQDANIELTLEPVVTGVPNAVYMAEAPDDTGRMFIVSRDGLIFVAEDGELAEQPFLDIQDRVVSDGGEMGLFSVAFHPNYAENGHFFVSFTSVEETNEVVRYTVTDDPNVADPESAVALLSLPDRAPIFHNGGMLAFGPDGYLYFGSGDEGLTYDRDGNSQSLQSLFGKILRLNPSTEADITPDEAYDIPPDNPYVDQEDASGEIWARGLRNPWRFSFDRVTGDLYIADVGQDTYEEVNFQPADSQGGENYGWNQMEASHCFPLDTECDTSPFTLPIIEYSHEETGGCAVIGGYVYRGTESPALIGSYLYADICSGEIWGARRDADGQWSRTLLHTTDVSITSFAEDQDGELYITAFQNPAVRKIVATGDNPQPLATSVIPAKSPAGEDVMVEVTGDYFVPGAEVRLNGEPVPTTYVDSTRLQADIPGSAVGSAGEAQITVFNPGPGGGESSSLPFNVQNLDPDDPAFESAWARTDLLVATGEIARTWIWGPQETSQAMIEPYTEAPGGERAVRYYDKARMEITEPGGASDSPWEVTNGLLVVEMMTGQVQVGHDDFESREPSEINVAGDPGAGPSYRVLGELRSPVEDRTDQPVTERLSDTGDVSIDEALAGQDVTFGYFISETGHNIAAPFWEFMNASGPVWIDGEIVEQTLFESDFYATGLPVTEPYWLEVDVAGESNLVLVQCFERRCLTYTPDNPEGWQIEAGNVGSHYFDWRYAG